MPARSKKKPKTEKVAPRPYHHGDLRRALLDAARAELHAVGHVGLSLRSVARRAGVTHTAAYHHFADKNALLLDIALEGFDTLDRRMAEAMDAAGADPLDRLVASGAGYLKMAGEDPMAYDLMFNGCDLVTLTEPQKARAQRSFHRLHEAVVVTRAATHRTDGDALQDAFVHWEVVHGLAMLIRTGQTRIAPFSLDDHVRYATEMTRKFYAR